MWKISKDTDVIEMLKWGFKNRKLNYYDKENDYLCEYV